MSDRSARPPRPASAWPTIPRWIRTETLWLIAVLLAALALRVIDLQGVPPGMQHDEVFDARFATLIRDGARPAFFDENAGVPPLFMYLVAMPFALFGRSLLALRLTAVAVGVAGLLVNYLLLRELLGRRVAMLTLAGLSVSFWHLFDSRVGLEPILIPLMAGLSFYAFWRALRSGALRWYLLAGLGLGLSPYAYHSGLLIPLTVGLFVLYLLLARHAWLRGERGDVSRGRLALGLAGMGLAAALIVLPMALHILGNQSGALLRVNTLSQHANQLLAGDPRPILGDILGVLGMFGWHGDPEWRYNVAGRPVFDPLSALLFLAGLALCVRKARRPEHLFLLFWLPINLIMAAITPPSPSSLRALGAIVPIFALPALALDGLWGLAERRGRRSVALLAAGIVLLWAGNAAWTVRDYFYIWPRHPQVRAIYRSDLATAARYVQQEQPAGTVLLSARFAADLDQQTFDYLLPQGRPLKWFDGSRTLVLPAVQPPQPATYIFPATDPITPEWREWLETAGATAETLAGRNGESEAEVFHLTPEQMERLGRVQPQYRLDVNLGDEIDLVGYDMPADLAAGETLSMRLYWRVRRGGRGPINYAFFAHVTDRDDFRWAQEDPPAFPSHSWWANDLVVQQFILPLSAATPPGSYTLRIGCYEQDGGRRLAQMLADGSVGPDSVELQPLTLHEAQRSPTTEELNLEERTDAAFAGRLSLLGYRIDDRILNLEDRVEVSFLWQALSERPAEATLVLRLTDEKRVQPQILLRRQLTDGRYPLDRWAADQVVRDRYRLVHAPEIPRAVYDLELGLEDAGTGQPLALPDGRSWVALGKVFMRGLK